MNCKPFEIDFDNKVKKIKTCIENEWIVQNSDIDILIREYEKIKDKLENKTIIINMMALDLKQEGENKKDVIEKYERGAFKWKRMKKNYY